ncbi:MAG: DMT family transporter [Flavobacteriales bacterium]|nr:DMT family transporter [Flavobacteriales bacterium]MCB9449400.1 DMT family transporter [Flavobacteriales bacterium]
MAVLRKEERGAHLALLGANLIYGGNYTVAKGLMPNFIEPLGFVVTRASVALVLFVLVSLRHKRAAFTAREYGLLALCGMFGVAFNQSLFFSGLALTHEINASIIMISSPIMVVLMGVLVLKEVLTMRKIVGILLGCSGAAFLILYGKDLSFGSDTLKGDLMVFLNATSYSIYLILVKPMMRKHSPFVVISWIFFFGSLFVLPFGHEQFMHAKWDAMETRQWVGVAYVCIGTTFLAYLLNIVALKTASPSLVSFYIYLQPFFASVIALSLGRDSLTTDKIIAAVLIFTGVFLVSRPASVKSANAA